MCKIDKPRNLSIKIFKNMTPGKDGKWNNFSNLESPHTTSVQYCGGCSVHRGGGGGGGVGRGVTSVLWGIPSVLWGIASVLWGIASVQWGITSVHAGITSVLWGITSVLWRVFSTVEGYLQYCGG